MKNQRHVTGLATVASGCAVLAGALVMLGWAIDSESLKRILPGLVAMNPTTALLFVLAGAALWLQLDPARPGGTRARLGRLLGATVLVVGLLKLGHYAFGWDIPLDRLLFASALDAEVPLPNRMAPNTALDFVLLGLALCTLDVTTRRGRRPVDVLACAIILVALLALTAYAYGIGALAGVGGYIPMAVHTAALFLLLSAGILAARPAVGIMAVLAGPTPGGVMARRLLPGMVLAFLVLGWLRLEGERHGLYGAGLGVALYTLTNVLVFGAMVGWSAKSLDAADAERSALAERQRESEARARLLLDSTAEAIYGIDVDGHCTFSNKACLRMLGYADSAQLLGKDMHALIHYARADGKPYPLEECRIYRAIHSDLPEHVDDEVFWRADGSSFAAEYWSYPVHRDDALVGAVVTFVDITARKEAQSRLQQSEAERDRFFSLSLDLLCIAGSDGYFKRISPAFTDALGWSIDEILARPFLDFVHPDDRTATLAEVERQITAGRPVQQFENRYRHRDGSWRVLSWRSVPHDGLMYATARDVTEHKQIEQMQAKFAAIVESSDDAIISKTLDGVITTWNPGAERIFGYTAAEAIGQPIAMLIPPERAAEEPAILARLRRGEREHFETVRVRKDGQRIDIAATISPIIDNTGHIVGASKIARDITERKRAEDSIRALNAELSAKARELEQSNRELEAFSYSISHDLRAPLRHIDGYARMLHEDAGDQLDADMRRYLDTISASARQMGVLIDDLLAFSRLGRQPVERTEVNMHALVERVMREVGDGGRVLLGSLPTAHADPVLLKQVWVNLLSNALKYSAPRGDDARIEISGAFGDGVVRYRIQDNGVGFDMRYADKLFGVFQRLHSLDEFEGTGVGLAIVQRIVSRHGGTIGAQAELGRGATFTFELPLGGHAVPDELDVRVISATEAQA